ncbi:hypothetical protein BT63DRAFT_85717 [Microthyrium microscopicum]|uniref:GPI anchored protein n=1 Tax=Microthyrium microscopicum TaxID=703497 RepID=A0A6A6TYG8_9PEZI|nr:hypothetical protein BT63DRAFT_85717 [Microthyrium microscopicum]
MRSVLLATLVFGASSLAALNERFVDNTGLIHKRQQFKPSTTTAEGSTCADAFGSGYVTCRDATTTANRLCYNPDLGQTCCSNNWACPSGAFCLASGACCPNGQSPQSCANQNGLTVSSDFHAPTSGPLISNSTVSTSSAKATSANAKPSQSALPSSGASSNLGRQAVGVAGALLAGAALL